MLPETSRRDFLKGTAALLGGLSLPSILTVPETAGAAATGGYKALVCILLEGGADMFNMIVPRQKSSWQEYRNVRKGLALSRSSLLPIDHADRSGNNPLRYGMRETMSGLQRLFGEEKLAIVANVGTLVRPVTLREIREGAPLPRQLFAHNTQRELWMLGDSKALLNTGWGGRLADRFDPGPHPWFNLTVGGENLLQSGGRSAPLPFENAEISPDTMRRYGFGPEAGGAQLGRTYQRLYADRRSASNRLLAALAKERMKELKLPYRLSGLFDGLKEIPPFPAGVHETGKPLGEQLRLVAQILSVHNNFPGRPRRQIFFVNHHGWDTHDSDNAHQSEYLSECMTTFQDTMERLGLEDRVTTFTLSDFGRSLSPNGAGTDHGWGNHALVMGGAVRGGEIYGTMPRISLDSPDAWEDRMIPTLASEQYLAEIVRWFGADNDDLDVIFPNLHTFGGPAPEFMS